MGNKGAFIRFEAPTLKPNIVTFAAVVSSFCLVFCIQSLFSCLFCALSFFYHFGTSIDDCFWIWEFSHLWWNCSLTLMSSQWHMQTISYECSNSISNLNGTVIPISYEFQNGGWTLPLEVKFVYSSWRKAFKILTNAALFRFFLLWISMSKETFFFFLWYFSLTFNSWEISGTGLIFYFEFCPCNACKLNASFPR